ncbi:hypothetical protein KJ756_01520 [Patescibacteria group bacterium]|nr:hypothetical protein [Patescibacteria group bacterium]MCG2808865.1 hypothetical protein [Candidatus Portnoybacteria bacterium]
MIKSQKDRIQIANGGKISRDIEVATAKLQMTDHEISKLARRCVERHNENIAKETRADC